MIVCRRLGPTLFRGRQWDAFQLPYGMVSLRDDATPVWVWCRSYFGEDLHGIAWDSSGSTVYVSDARQARDFQARWC